MKRVARRIRRFMRWLTPRVLFTVSLVVFMFSLNWLGAIGLEGMIQYLAFLASGTYLVVFCYVNFWKEEDSRDDWE